MGKKEEGQSAPMIKVGTSLTWPFSLEQYQNGKVSAWAETEVPSGLEKEAYKELRKIVQEEVNDQMEEIQKSKGQD